MSSKDKESRTSKDEKDVKPKKERDDKPISLLKEKPGERKLEEYSFGELVGKGGAGSVYKALNTLTGQVTAIKQVRIQDLPKDQVVATMAEIDLLKRLQHKNIVAYHGFIKTKEYLNIIMEFADNGSLASVVKTFGKLPESLVLIYMIQVLEGLVYLHDQGVIHRDIKGANILTTKDGIVKLADFGVATKMEKEKGEVVGTPYWMAPEIIELNGAQPSSDIWSVGCTIIELLTKKPPYFDLAPMTALFRIVSDEYPPIPETTPCFQKDPNLRVSAQMLLNHPWIQCGRKKQSMPEALPSLIQSEMEKERQDASKKAAQPALLDSSRAYAKKDRRMSKAPGDLKKFADDEDDAFADMDGAAAPKKDVADGDEHEQGLSLKKKTKKKVSSDTVKTKKKKDGTIVPTKTVTPVVAVVPKAPIIDDTDNWDDIELPTSGSTAPATVTAVAPKPAVVHKPARHDDDDADWDDVFDGEMTSLSDKIVKLKVQEAVDEIADDIDDPFGNFDDNIDPELEKKAIVGEQLLRAIDTLHPSETPEKILEACETLLTLLKNHPGQTNHLTTHHAIMPIIEMLEVQNDGVISAILKVINHLMEGSQLVLENLCLLGCVPAVMKFCSVKYNNNIRMEAAYFVLQMCNGSDLTLQMFIACRGTASLVGLLDSEYKAERDLILMGIDGLWAVFELKSMSLKNDFCRLFVNHDKTLDGIDDYISRVLAMILVFSKADQVVKRSFADLTVMKNILEPLSKKLLSPDNQLTLLKAIKNVSMQSHTLDTLHQAGPLISDLHNQVLPALFNLCKFNKSRQEAAADAGIVPCLQYFVTVDSPLKQFALSILCYLSHASARARAALWANNGVEFYLSVLHLDNWEAIALDSIGAWLIQEPAKIEKSLLTSNKTSDSPLDHVVQAFKKASRHTFDGLLEPLLAILTVSTAVNKTLGSTELVSELLHRLTVKNTKPVVRVNVLKVLTLLFEGHPKPKEMIKKFNMETTVRHLMDDQVVLVKTLATNLVNAFASSIVI